MNHDQERFDIFDKHFQPAGTASRKEVHAVGLWHRTFQCWILTEQDGEPALLFQKRHPQKDTYPGLLDISCAGHLLAGEQAEDGCRELEEELGITVAFEHLVPCGVYHSDRIIASDLIDREMCHIFLYRSDLPIESYRLQADELTGLFLLSVEDVKRLAQSDGIGEKFWTAGVELDSGGGLKRVERTFSAVDFVPRNRDYYEMLLNMTGRVSRLNRRVITEMHG
jgi:isopentenyldiphosphate isomerase